MKLTRYFCYVELDDNIYAIYNELIEKVMYINKNMLINIILNKNLEKEDKYKLKENCIYENIFTGIINRIRYKNSKKKFSEDMKRLKLELQSDYLKLLLK